MRQNVVSTENSSTRVERNKAFRAVMLQLLAAVCIGLIWWFFKDLDVFKAVVLGGLALSVPSFLFTWGLFAIVSPTATKRLAIVFFVGEFVKLVVSALALAFVVVHLQYAILPVFVGFIGAQFGAWLVPLLFKNNSTKGGW